MADYHPLIASAVAGLDKNTGEARRSLYDRARTALVAQLRSVDPPLNDSDITRERLALEEAIRKVEAKSARKVRSEPARVDPAPKVRAPDAKHWEAVSRWDEPAQLPPDEPPQPVRKAMPPAWPEPAPLAPLAPDAAEHDDDFEEDPRPPPRSYRGLMQAASALVLMLSVGGVVAWQWPSIMLLWDPSVVEAPNETPPTTRPRFADQLDPGGPQPPPNAGSSTVTPAGAAVAQRVVLYEEDPADPQGKRFVGSAIWRTETISPGPGRSPELTIRADIEIPDLKLAMTWSLRRNTDQSLPASHIVEVMFKLPPDFPAGSVSNVPGILMKQTEQAKGVALAGVATKVTNGFFLIGLSAVETERDKNIQLLKERSWLDIPVVYTNNRRAILGLEKGNPGERTFAEVFQAWGQ
jgi:hypothetical protein